MSVPHLSRDTVPGTSPAPVRLVHLGLGAFFRAHQAWYTALAGRAAGNETGDPATTWGIAAFTGRSPGVARVLAAQDGLYTLLTRGSDGDEAMVVDSVVAAHAAADTGALTDLLQDPAVGAVTLTVTEFAYRRRPDGGLDHDDEAVAADTAAVRDGGRSTPWRAVPLQTVPARLVVGLAARRAAGTGGLALVSCDNLAGNGPALARVVTDLCADLDDVPAFAGLRDWVADEVTFPSTMVDRITPATVPGDLVAAQSLTGYADAAPVVTEPFSEWVLAGAFPAGRPRWEDAGARFVEDVSPFEDRKLWLLNGGHSLLAYEGPPLGHTTVAEAVADPRLRHALDDLWDTAAPYLRLPAREVADYREALLARWSNPRIAHRLAQIGASGSDKLAVRVVPLLRRHLADGDGAPEPLTHVLGAWLAHLRGTGEPVDDPRAEVLVAAAAGPVAEAARRVLAALAAELADDPAVVRAVAQACRETEAAI